MYRSLLLINWLVSRELANFIYIRLCRDSEDPSWIQRFDSRMDYETELERKALDGRFLTTGDFTRLGVDCGDGEGL